MNDRIKQLAEQATSTHTHLSPGGTFEETTRYFNEEKFAELIVRETLQVARAGIEYGPSMEEVVYKYFGVKE